MSLYLGMYPGLCYVRHVRREGGLLDHFLYSRGSRSTLVPLSRI
jgi:hypothetical protein